MNGDDANWYAVYTAARAEKRVKKTLDESGFENYLPLHRSPRVWSDRIKMLDIPLFNCYIFVRCKMADVPALVRTAGVVKVVYHSGKPAVIRQEEIDAIRAFLQQAAGRKLCTGDEVEILTGSMKHVSGEIVRIDKKYILLYIEHLSATVCVNAGNVAHADRLGKV